MKTPRRQLKKGDMVRVVQAGGTLGDTVYRLSWVYGLGCQIEERRKDGSFCKPQDFDLSLLAPDRPVSKRLSRR